MIQVVDEKDLGAELDMKIRRTLCVCFPRAEAHFSQARGYHGSSPAYTVVALSEDGRVSAHVGVVDRLIRVDQKSVRVAGVQNVCVLPEYRGGILFSQVMWQAMDQARQRGFDAGLLFCSAQLEKLYAWQGWRAMGDVSVRRIDEAGQELPLPVWNRPMYYPLRMERFPAGVVHLGGNDW